MSVLMVNLMVNNDQWWLLVINGGYTFSLLNSLLWNMVHWFIYEKGGFSIATLNNQKVVIKEWSVIMVIITMIYWNNGIKWETSIINHAFGNGLYHLFIVIWGMVYYCFTHINVANQMIANHPIIEPFYGGHLTSPRYGQEKPVLGVCWIWGLQVYHINGDITYPLVI